MAFAIDYPNSTGSISSAITDAIGVRLAVVGDSMSVQNYALGDPWPVRLGQVLNQNGVKVDLRIFGVNADSYYRLINNTPYNGTSTLQEVIDYDPHYVIVVCGHNDTINPIDSRTLTQVQADATSFFSQLRTGLPDALIYYGAQIAYDKSNFTTSTVLNKGIAPAYWTLNSSGILADSWTSEIEDNAVGSTKRGELANFESLDTTIKALGTIDDYFDIQAWRIARLGLTITDGLHFNEAGHSMLAASVMDGLVDIDTPLIANLADQVVVGWQSFDTIWGEYMTTDGGDGWTYSQPEDNGAAGTDDNLGRRFRPNSWFMPYKSQFNFAPLNISNDTTATSIFSWYIHETKPNTAVENSIEGGAFGSAGFTTDEKGYVSTFVSAGPLSLPDDTYTFRFKVDNMIYDPVDVVLTT